MWSWGYTGARSFGIEDPYLPKTPHLTDTMDVLNVSAGRGHLAIVTKKGKLFTQGGGAFFRLGHGDTNNCREPKPVNFITGNVLTASAGGCHTAAITSNGFLWTWGFGKFGALGHGDTETQKKPKVVEALKNVTQVSAGRDHTLALTSEGLVYSFGYGGAGALGLGDNCNCYNPTLVKTLTNVVKVVAASTFSAALTSQGDVYTWGTSDEGVLGHGSDYSVSVPRKIADLSDIVSISCGYFHMAAINRYGVVYTWGNGYHGKIMQGKDSSKRWVCTKKPTKVEALEGKVVSQIGCGLLHTSVLVDIKAVLDKATEKGDLFEQMVWYISQGEKYVHTALAALKYMLTRPRYNFSSSDQSGKTVLHWSVIYKNASFLTLLIQNKDDSFNINITDKEGYSALHYACLNADLQCSKILIDNNINLDLCNENGKVAFDLVDSDSILYQLKEMSGKKDVFLSYGLSELGTRFTQQLRDTLEQDRLLCWMDEKVLRAGNKWLDEISRAIDDCSAFIFVVSEKSLKSENCAYELQRALEKKKKIFPVLFESQDLNNAPPPYSSLKSYQWVDFSVPANFSTSYKKLLKGLKDIRTQKVASNVQPTMFKPFTSSAEPSGGQSGNKKPSFESKSGHNKKPAGFMTEDPDFRRMRPDSGFKVAIIHELGFGAFLERMLRGGKMGAEDLGLDLTIYNGEGKRTLMVEHIGKAIANNTDSIILNHGGPELYPSLEMAVDRGIKVITIDLNVENPLITEIQQDDFALSFQICKQLIQDMNGNANVIYMSQPELQFAPLIKRDKVWQSYKWQYKGLNEIAMIGQVSANVVNTSKTETLKILKEFPNVNIILAMWDQFAHGAVEAIKLVGKEDDISVYSVDISDQVINEMNHPNSPWKCSVGLDSWLLGNMAVRCAWACLNGVHLGKYILLDPIVIKQEYILQNSIKDIKQLVRELPELKSEAFLKKYPFLRKPQDHPHTAPTAPVSLPQVPLVQPLPVQAALPQVQALPVPAPQVVPKEVPIHQPNKRVRVANTRRDAPTRPPKKPQMPSPLAQSLGLPFL
eukprot:TRINITY_DN10106_c0_g1_i1.p1 TRINITY_DN10106_c0_g1~~TRINITY_DN10106_c0_g1_i1.p1  ORF type:complete len:1099 (-),score=241.44 TRINITY_DN10106_c0_g1_i1:25-3159(-)